MRLQVESEVVVFALGSARQRLPTARAADRFPHSAGPGSFMQLGDGTMVGNEN